jgi:hypothetical protein
MVETVEDFKITFLTGLGTTAICHPACSTQE